MGTDPRALISIKRDGAAWSAAQIRALVAGIVDGRLDDVQLGALAMATFIRGLSPVETARLTVAIGRSGQALRWDRARLRGPVVDKHSTGGIGDTVSLLLGPMLAAADCHVPMLSGRGLGMTGGTLDKLESIPGYDCAPPLDRFCRVVEEVGVAIAGAGDLAPADRRLYSARDASGTVDSVGLITASILGKKLAEGLDALVLDVKQGRGALCADMVQARRLAAGLLGVAEDIGLPASLLITAMDQPLGPSAGNALEVRLAIDCLTDRRQADRLTQVTVSLGEALLDAAGLADRIPRFRRSLTDGRAAEALGRMVAGLGGPADLVEQPDRHLPVAPVRVPLLAGRGGRIERVDALDVGQVVHELGGGRSHAGAPIDHAVGVSDLVTVGETVEPGQPLAWVHARSQDDADRALLRLRRAFETDLTRGRPNWNTDLVENIA